RSAFEGIAVACGALQAIEQDGERAALLLVASRGHRVNRHTYRVRSPWPTPEGGNLPLCPFEGKPESHSRGSRRDGMLIRSWRAKTEDEHVPHLSRRCRACHTAVWGQLPGPHHWCMLRKQRHDSGVV